MAAEQGSSQLDKPTPLHHIPVFSKLTTILQETGLGQLEPFEVVDGEFLKVDEIPLDDSDETVGLVDIGGRRYGFFGDIRGANILAEGLNMHLRGVAEPVILSMARNAAQRTLRRRQNPGPVLLDA